MEMDNKTFDFQQLIAVRERAVGRLTWRIKRHIDAVMEPRLQAMGFIDFKMSYLQFLSNLTEEGLTNNDLAKRACVTKQAMSKVVNLLEAGGYIYTERNEFDSRSSTIFLSNRGKALLEAVYNSMQTCIRERLVEVVGEERWEQMIDTMVSLVKHLDQETDHDLSVH